MASAGITHVLSLQAADELASYTVDPVATLAEVGLSASNVGVKAPGACDAAMAAIEGARAAGGKVVVHCWGGGGRAGRVAAAWLMRAHGLNADQAVAEIESAAATFNVSRRADTASLAAFVGR